MLRSLRSAKIRRGCITAQRSPALYHRPRYNLISSAGAFSIFSSHSIWGLELSWQVLITQEQFKQIFFSQYLNSTFWFPFYCSQASLYLSADIQRSSYTLGNLSPSTFLHPHHILVRLGTMGLVLHCCKLYQYFPWMDDNFLFFKSCYFSTFLHL